jgi:hypothetical protein
MNAKPKILYDSILDGATLAATDTESGYNVDNIVDLRTYTLHRFNAAGTKYITADCGAALSADALAIVGHNLKTAAATVSVEYSSDNFSTDINVALAGFQPSDDTALLKEFTTHSARYWRIKVVTASVAAQMGVALLGEVLTFERIMSAGGFDPCSEKLIAESLTSKVGNLLGSNVRYVETGITPRWKMLTTSWLENNFRAAWDNHLSLLKPFIWAWDITNHASEIYFVRIPEKFRLKMPLIPGNPDYRSLALTLTGVKE